MGVWYATRESVKASLEVNTTSYADPLIDRKLDGSSRSVEEQMHRRFYPELKTVKFDYPNWSYSPAWRLWLDDNEIVTKDGLILQCGGTTIDNDDIILRRSDGRNEPPYTHLELLTSSAAAFGGGPTFQESTVLTALYGYQYDWLAGGELSAGINSSVTTVDLLPLNSYFDVGVGSLIMVGTERMLVTNRRLLDTTQNLQTTMDARNADTIVDVTDGSTFAPDEIILIDAERMRIVDIAGNNLIVERAFDGTNVASHAGGADIYSMRRFTVQRGALGSTAAAHSSGDDVSVFQYPGLVEELANAETIVMLEQASGAYATTVGSGDSGRDSAGKGLPEIQARCWNAHARKSRIGAI